MLVFENAAVSEAKVLTLVVSNSPLLDETSLPELDTFATVLKDGAVDTASKLVAKSSPLNVVKVVSLSVSVVILDWSVDCVVSKTNDVSIEVLFFVNNGIVLRVSGTAVLATMPIVVMSC